MQSMCDKKTPILCEALPSFQRMIAAWERYQVEMPNYTQHIRDGLSKLYNYYHCAIEVPAYQLAICIKSYFLNVE